MHLELITAPVVDPVTLAQVRKQCVLEDDFTDDDALLSLYIKAATARGEHLTRRQFVAATYDLTVNSWASTERINLPRPPAQSIVSITAIAVDGGEKTIDADEFNLIQTSLISHVEPVEKWPEAARIVIRFVTGWPITGDSEEGYTATTPADVQSWILIRVAGLYENREPVIIGQTVNELPADFVDGLLDAHVVPVVI